MLRPHLAALSAGALFSVGLAIAGMTRPHKVVAFLDVGGAWDPSLAFVMGAALLVYGVGLPLVLRREAPLFGGRFLIPTRRDLNARLVGGAAIFGVGWGISGFCPGPAITATGAGATDALIFVPAMGAGMLLFSGWDRWVSAERSGTTAE